jgi:HAMP domain-containing protein
MRGKIIAVFAVVVLVVGGLSYALTRATLGDLSVQGEVPRALNAASAQIQLDGLVLERWLAKSVNDEKLREPFNAGTPNARADAATNEANRMHGAAQAAPELAGITPALVVLVDKNGVVLGRNGSALMRGDDLGAVYSPLKAAITKGVTGSDVWVNRKRNEQYLASYAPIRGNDGAIIGGLAIATPMNDERLSEASARTSGLGLVAVIKDGDGLDIVAKSTAVPDEAIAKLKASPSKDAPLQALQGGQVLDVGGLPQGLSASTHTLDGYGDGRRLALVCFARPQVNVLAALIWPTLGVIVLGLILVVIGAYFLDVYISRPISELEDGLLAIMNGRTDRRFEIEHAELGGLVFRLNSLLNQLLGVQEDDTDDQGRPSRAPAATSFQDALAVDERMTSLSAVDVVAARALREESDGQYYQRIYDEYISAKRQLGDPVDHITPEAFISRIQASERETSEKHGKPVRYKVEVRGKEVILLAVPLA